VPRNRDVAVEPHAGGHGDARADVDIGGGIQGGGIHLRGGMVEHDLELAQQELTLVRAGHIVAPRGGAHG